MRIGLVSVVCKESDVDATTAGSRIASAIEEAERCGAVSCVVADNSIEPWSDVTRCLDQDKHVHMWNEGYNELYGGAINRSVSLLKKRDVDVIVYVSSKRGGQISSGWMQDAIDPLNDSSVGMSGCVQPCSYCCISQRESAVNLHIQGALWAARTSVISNVPYSSRFWQVYSDVWISWKLQELGYSLADVPSIMCVPSGAVVERSKYKYVVDYPGE